ncbi:MAG TPA: nuclear transport factor 2 family protein [Gemmatimonadales bacterium]|jgi:ketosteroid isomerase-like protein
MILPLAVALEVCRPRDPDVRSLLQLEDGWASAVVRRDSATFERLLDPEFVYTENDRLESRAEVLRDVIHGADTVTAAHNEDMVVHCFGTTAVVTGWLVLEGRGGSGAFVRRYRFTDTWVKRNGRWRIVAAEDYFAPHP